MNIKVTKEDTVKDKDNNIERYMNYQIKDSHYKDYYSVDDKRNKHPSEST